MEHESGLILLWVTETKTLKITMSNYGFTNKAVIFLQYHIFIEWSGRKKCIISTRDQNYTPFQGLLMKLICSERVSKVPNIMLQVLVHAKAF